MKDASIISVSAIMCCIKHCKHIIYAEHKRTCAHHEGKGKAVGGMSDAAFKAHMGRFFDPSTGRQRLLCLSRTPVPENIAASDRAEEYQGWLLPHFKVISKFLP
jgi:hypothetical protein